MFRFELKKLLHYRRGFWLILLLLVAELGGILLFTSPYDANLESHRQAYDGYLAQVEGPLTPEKRQWIEGEMAALNLNHIKMEQLKSDYYSGALGEEEFRAKFDELLPQEEYYPAFSSLYSQYIYVRETDNRYFLYTGGWEVLLGDHTPDYLMLLALVFLLTMVFCQEYGNQMDTILRTQAVSAGRQWQTKTAVAVALAVVLATTVQLFQLAYCALLFGLPQWDYPLQSLVSFGSVKKELSLAQAFGLQFGLKLLGYVYASVLVLAFSVLLKKTALVLMAGIVTLALPLLTVNDPAVLLRIPGPWAFSIGSIYLGSHSYLASSAVHMVEEVTWGELGGLVMAAFLIIAILLLCIRWKNRNYHIKGKKPVAAISLLALLLTLSACQTEGKATIYNTASSNHYEYGQYLVFSLSRGTSLVLDKESGALLDFPLDAFTGETVSSSGHYYGEGNTLYYLKTNKQYRSGSSELGNTYTVLAALDLDTMQERVAYQWNMDTDWFFGLLQRDSLEPYAGAVPEFFLHGSKMYYIQNNEILAMDLRSGSYESFLELPNATNLAYDGQSIYYTDSYHRLVIHDLDSGKTRTIEEVVAKDFLLTEKGIYFLNRRDQDTLYHWHEETATAQKLDDMPAYSLYWDESYCWVQGFDGLRRMNHDGIEITEVVIPGFIAVFPTGSVFYTVDYGTNTLYAIDKTTLDASIVSK